MSLSGLKKWIAFGSGVGIQIAGPRGAESLRIAAVRVRPAGARVVGSMIVEDFPHQASGVWGNQYTAFLRKLGLRHAVATVILPRAAVIVRPLTMPGVSNKDLDSAVRFQMDGLHPYNEDDVYSAWTRLPGTSTVLVAVARKDAVERYAAPLEEAGIRVVGFTCSAAAVYSALRLFGAKPAPDLLAVDDSAGELEYYGESPTRPVFSASFELGNERAAALAASELRIPSDTEPVPLVSLLGALPSKSAPQPTEAAQPADAAQPTDTPLPSDAVLPTDGSLPSDTSLPTDAPLGTDASQPSDAALSTDVALRTDAPLPSNASQPAEAALPTDAALPFAAALSSACPHLCLPLNLLPVERRQAGSRMRWAPAVAFGTLVLLLAGALAALPAYENRKYLKSLEAQIAAVSPRAERAAAIDKQMDTLRRRTQLLDDLRRHPRADMDVLAELTRILPPPTWLSLMQISAKQVIVGGETPEAAPLVPLLDSSHLFEASEFQAPPLRIPGGEQFRIKTNRKGVR